MGVWDAVDVYICDKGGVEEQGDGLERSVVCLVSLVSWEVMMFSGKGTHASSERKGAEVEFEVRIVFSEREAGPMDAGAACALGKEEWERRSRT